MADGAGYLEIAHAIPGRLRLRWRGEGAPPPVLVERLRGCPGVTNVDFRPSSQSLLLRHQNGLDTAQLQALSRELGVETREPPPPELRLPTRKDAPEKGPQEWLVADIEAVLLVGLMASWMRDLVVGRTLRIGTVMLLLLTGLNLWDYWQKRQHREGADEPEPELELELSTA